MTPDKLSAVSYDPLTHSRHNAGDKIVKVGHEINRVSKSKPKCFYETPTNVDRSSSKLANTFVHPTL